LGGGKQLVEPRRVVIVEEIRGKEKENGKLKSMINPTARLFRSSEKKEKKRTKGCHTMKESGLPLELESTEGGKGMRHKAV